MANFSFDGSTHKIIKDSMENMEEGNAIMIKSFEVMAEELKGSGARKLTVLGDTCLNEIQVVKDSNSDLVEFKEEFLKSTKSIQEFEDGE